MSDAEIRMKKFSNQLAVELKVETGGRTRQRTSVIEFTEQDRGYSLHYPVSTQYMQDEQPGKQRRHGDKK